MSEENVELVRRDIAARDARDWTDLADIWHPDIELNLVRGSGTYRGIDQITEFLDTLSNLHADYRVEAGEVLDAGDQVVTVERVSGRGLKGSVADGWIGETLFKVIGFKDGRMWRVTEYPTRSKALEAAGLRE
jgi:ketosteroid isomerase-like protein